MAHFQLSDEFVVDLTAAQDRLFGFIFKRTANRDQAREILQETNLVLCKKAEDYTQGTNFIAWAFRVAHFQILAYRKKTSREKLIFDDDLLAELEAVDTDARRSERDRRREALANCLLTLSEGHRKLLERRYFNSETVQDIAAEIDKSVNAVSKILHRTRNSLQKCVNTRLREADA